METLGNGTRAEHQDKTFIPAKPPINIYEPGRTLRVCAYCRVSTDNDAQLSSFELQQAHYQQLAESHHNWDLRHIYADRGISGTSLKRRDAFNEMIDACRAGEYDLIVTKEVSRFARNLIDCVSIMRELKQREPPVGIFFETNNLDTLSENADFLLTFLARFAEEESVRKSDSMNWSLRQRFKDGKLLTPELLGYRRPRDAAGGYIKYGKLEIVESEAQIVRFIFQAFLAGRTSKEIAALLTDIQCPTKTGGTEWSEGSINYILRNERYCGDVLTWKTFTADLYEHKHKRNRQDRDQYRYRGHHDPIITVETFEAVQQLLVNRKHRVRSYPTMQVIDEGIFSGYVPINHHWINEDPGSYYDASNSVKREKKIKQFRRSTFSSFDLRDYQVVRGPFLTVRNEHPHITISDSQITFSVNCVRKFQEVPYIQLLLHPAERKIAIRPCGEADIYSIRWRPDPQKRFGAKTIHCRSFGNALFQIMEWDPDYFYRVQGIWASRDREQIIVFSLPEAVPMASAAGEGSLRKRRVPFCAEEWGDTFGQEFYDHCLQNMFIFPNSHVDWNTQAKSVSAPGAESISILSEAELQSQIQLLGGRVGVFHGE